MAASDARKRTKLSQDFGSGNPANWYWALSTTEPAADGSGFTEPVGAGYARVLMTNNVTNFPAPTTSAGVTAVFNGVDVTWPNPTGTWGLVGWYGLFLASTGGQYEYSNKLDTAITPKSGNTPVQLAANSAKITVA